MSGSGPLNPYKRLGERCKPVTSTGPGYNHDGKHNVFQCEKAPENTIKVVLKLLLE